MSKRGSRNAKNFSGRKWSLGRVRSGSVKKTKWEKRREKKQKAAILKKHRQQTRLQRIYRVFEIESQDEKETVKEMFYAIEKIGKQQRAAFNAGFYKFYCEKKSIPLSVTTFFKSGAATTNFKKEECDMYQEYLAFRKMIKKIKKGR